MYIAIRFMAMVSVLQITLPGRCSMHSSVRCGFMLNMIAGPIWWHERWHTIHAGQPALVPIASCMRGYYGFHLSELQKGRDARWSYFTTRNERWVAPGVS